jgi:phytanoyl-CoA hydroxylase
MPVLTHERSYRAHAAEFAADGVTIVGQILTAGELEEIRYHIDRYCRHVVPNLPPAILEKTVRFESDGDAIRSCYFMDQIDEYFNELGNQPRFKELVRDVVGYEPELYVVETFNKYARVGSEAAAHQDSNFLPLDPMDMAHLWIAIDEVTPDNGPLRYWPGTQTLGLMRHVPAQFGARLDPDLVDYDSPEIMSAILPAGSAVVHHGLVIHDSPPNLTNRPRLGLLCGYRGAHTRYLLDGPLLPTY